MYDVSGRQLFGITCMVLAIAIIGTNRFFFYRLEAKYRRDIAEFEKSKSQKVQEASSSRPAKINNLENGIYKTNSLTNSSSDEQSVTVFGFDLGECSLQQNIKNETHLIIKDEYKQQPDITLHIEEEENKNKFVSGQDLTQTPTHLRKNFQNSSVDTYVIEYIDINGEITSRKIWVESIEKSAYGHIIVHAFCFLRNESRSFRSDRMISLINLENGSSIQDPKKHFKSHFILEEW